MKRAGPTPFHGTVHLEEFKCVHVSKVHSTGTSNAAGNSGPSGTRMMPTNPALATATPCPPQGQRSHRRAVGTHCWTHSLHLLLLGLIPPEPSGSISLERSLSFWPFKTHKTRATCERRLKVYDYRAERRPTQLTGEPGERWVSHQLQKNL